MVPPVPSLPSWSTEQLTKLATAGPCATHSPGDVAWASELLVRRGLERPVQQPSHEPSTVLKLRSKSNATVRRYHHGKVEFRFGKDGFLEPDQFEFKDRQELQTYLSTVLGFSSTDEPRLSLSRKGRYRRVDHRGDPIFTFGDPVLDLITNRHGLTIVGNDVYDFRSKVITDGVLHGGRLGVDLAPRLDEMERHLLAEANSPKGGYTLLEADKHGMAFASRNPSSMVFTATGSGLLRFSAWRTNAFFYWSIGADIDCIGANFVTASVDSKYGEFGGNSNICNVVKRDSDSDANDDYVDERETGAFGSPPKGVESRCRANWGGATRNGTVSKGSCGAWNG
jgi:hypothetical protein